MFYFTADHQTIIFFTLEIYIGGVNTISPVLHEIAFILFYLAIWNNASKVKNIGSSSCTSVLSFFCSDCRTLFVFQFSVSNVHSYHCMSLKLNYDVTYEMYSKHTITRNENDLVFSLLFLYC